MEAANGGWTVMDHLFISLSLSLFLVDRKIKGKKRKKNIKMGPTHFHRWRELHQAKQDLLNVYIEKGKEEETNQFGGKIKTKRGGEILKEQQQHEEVLFFITTHREEKKRKRKDRKKKG